eukprot:gb/GEZN01002389.1/.p1 GENE.gb/GEZN01002389.1/~~gb/GEZN01002389.1/.p1  ORF type:complete len:647 (-),score=68.77 gb/GEZN01002389.1/:427-2367(-)
MHSSQFDPKGKIVTQLKKWLQDEGVELPEKALSKKEYEDLVYKRQAEIQSGARPAPARPSSVPARGPRRRSLTGIATPSSGKRKQRTTSTTESKPRSSGAKRRKTIGGEFSSSSSSSSGSNYALSSKHSRASPKSSSRKNSRAGHAKSSRTSSDDEMGGSSEEEQAMEPVSEEEQPPSESEEEPPSQHYRKRCTSLAGKSASPVRKRRPSGSSSRPHGAGKQSQASSGSERNAKPYSSRGSSAEDNASESEASFSFSAPASQYNAPNVISSTQSPSFQPNVVSSTQPPSVQSGPIEPRRSHILPTEPSLPPQAPAVQKESEEYVGESFGLCRLVRKCLRRLLQAAVLSLIVVLVGLVYAELARPGAHVEHFFCPRQQTGGPCPEGTFTSGKGSCLPCLPCPQFGGCEDTRLRCQHPYVQDQSGKLCVLNKEGKKLADTLRSRAVVQASLQLGRSQCGHLNVTGEPERDRVTGEFMKNRLQQQAKGDSVSDSDFEAAFTEMKKGLLEQGSYSGVQLDLEGNFIASEGMRDIKCQIRQLMEAHWMEILVGSLVSLAGICWLYNVYDRRSRAAKSKQLASQILSELEKSKVPVSELALRKSLYPESDDPAYRSVWKAAVQEVEAHQRVKQTKLTDPVDKVTQRKAWQFE